MLPLHGLPSRVALPRTVPVWPACEDLNAKEYVMGPPVAVSCWVQGDVLLQDPPVIAESVAPLGPPDMYPIVYVPNG